MKKELLPKLHHLSLLIILISFTINSAYAQYTLTDNDVVVTNGIIQSCSYDFTIKDIIIPATLDGQTVTGIADGTYSWYGVFNDEGITSIELPATITSIGDYAFRENSLTSLDLSACTSLIRIGEEAFRSNSLTTVDLTACTSLTRIEISAFWANSGLSSLVLPTPGYPGFTNWIDNYGTTYAAGATVTNFSRLYTAVIPYTLADDDVVVTNGIIQSCSYDFTFTDITIPATLDGQTVTGILDADWSTGVFYDKGITSLRMPATLINIGHFTFRGNPLLDVDLSACTALTTIGDGAFADISSLTRIDFSSCTSLSSIGEWAFRANRLSVLDLSNNTALAFIGGEAFSGNAMSELYLPNSLTHIGGGAFTNNQITMLNGSSSDGLIFGRNDDTSIDYTTLSSYGGASNSVIIPASIVIIEDNAFQACRVSSVDFSACTNLTTIGATAFYSNSLGDLDLSNCTALTTVKTWAFLGAGLTSLNLSGCSSLTRIEHVAFYSNRLTSADLSGCTSLEYIGRGAFRFNSLPNIDLSDCATLDTIMFNAFSDNSLTEVGLPINSITHLGYAAFNDNDITTVNGNPSDGIFYRHTENATIDSTFVVSYGGVSTDVIIPGQVEKIGRDGFSGNSLTSVDFSNCKALTEIERHAFQSNSLSNIDLSPCTALTKIGTWAFLSNTLTEFALPTLSIPGYQFNHWNGGGQSYAGGATTSDLYSSYWADLSGILTITFTVTDGQNPIEGASVQLGSHGTVTTNSAGIAVFENLTPENDIDYVISATGYDTESGTVSAVDSDVNKDVALNLTTYNVNFTITSGTNPIEGAIVSFTGYGTATTNESGIAIFSNVAPEKDIAYTVSATHYYEVSGAVTVVDNDISEEITLQRSAYNVNFTITSGTNPIEGATVSLTGYGTATSNASGLAVFSGVVSSDDIAYSVSATGYNNSNGTVSVIDSDVNKEVVLNPTTYNVTFAITSGTNPIGGAFVSLEGYGNTTSDASGIAVFNGVVPENDITYTVSATNYDETNGTVSVVDSDVNEEVELNPTTYNVTFSITSGTNPVEGATVSLEGYGDATSDAFGIAVFNSVASENDIAYSVSATNYGDASGTVSVIDGDVNENVNLTITGFNDLGTSKIMVFPNPVVNVLTITHETKDKIKWVELYKLNGQKAYIKPVIGSKSVVLNVSSLRSGTYILKFLTQSKKMFSKKIFKK